VLILGKTWYMQFYGISFMHPFKQSGRWQNQRENLLSSYTRSDILFLLVFNPWASLGRNQSPVRRPVWLSYAAFWAILRGSLPLLSPLLISIINLFHQGYDCPVGYELLNLVDWYRQGVWQIWADVTEEYATSFIRVLCCPGDDV